MLRGLYYTSVQLNIMNPSSGGWAWPHLTNYGLVVEYMDRAQGPTQGFFSQNLRGVMVNPDFRVDVNYSPTPEIPLPLSLSGICPFTNLYTLSFQLLPSGGGLEPGSWKLPHPLLFYPWASRADSGSWNLPSVSHLPC